MSRLSDEDLLPHNGHTLEVGIIARISGCDNQKEASLEDQDDHGKSVVELLWSGPVNFRTIATVGKGERLDRPELAEIEAILRSGTLDLLVIEDLGRLVRGAEAVRLLGIGVDAGTRSISPNDGVDTADPNWEQIALAACSEHVRHNSQTSMRLKQKMMNRFLKQDAAYQRPICGYIVPEGATTFGEWSKDESLTQGITAGAELLYSSLNCAKVADWLNRNGVPVGPYCRNKEWDGPMVGQFYRNRLLSGRAQRGRRHTKKHFGSGRRISVLSPCGPQYREKPHLAHLDPAWHDELIERLDSRNVKRRRPHVNGKDPLADRSRKWSRPPGKHALCWYCGREYVWGANGISGHLMCNGAREWRCWNSIGFDGEFAVNQLMSTVTTELSSLDSYDAQLRSLIESAYNDSTGGLEGRFAKLRAGEASHRAARDNLAAVAKAAGPSKFVLEQIAELDAEEIRLKRERSLLESQKNRRLVLPESPAVIRQQFEEELRRLGQSSFEFAMALRKLVPTFHVYLVRSCDGGHLLSRARITLALGANFADVQRWPALSQLLTRSVTVDLFKPVQRDRIRAEAVRLNDGRSHKQIAAEIAERPTATAVGNALALQRKMDELRLTDPYVTLFEPPDDYPKLRRHKNPRYRFEPLDGYMRPTI